jgi:hypothetical protein
LKTSAKQPSSSAPAIFTGTNNEDIARLVSEVQKLRHIMDEKFNNLLNLIDQKADKAEVESLERRVTEKLNELI